MATLRSWTQICPDCEKYVEILNRDFESSMTLHKQSHKSLDSINQGLDCTQEKTLESSRFKTQYCNECKELITIINNDVGLSLKLHAQQHKPSHPDHSSTSSKKKDDIKVNRKRKPCIPIQEQMPSTNSELSKAKEAKKMTKNIEIAAGHALFDKLSNHNEIMQRNSRYLVKDKLTVGCKLCGQAVCGYRKNNKMAVKLITHLTGVEHLDNLNKEFNNFLDKEQLFSSEINTDRRFLMRQHNMVCCSLCNCEICDVNNIQLFRNSLLLHLTGREHEAKKTALEESCSSTAVHSLAVRNTNNTLSKDSADFESFLDELLKHNETIKGNSRHIVKGELTIECKLCKVKVSNYKGIEKFESKLTSHFTGEQHKRKQVKEFNNLIKVKCQSPHIKTNRRFLVRKYDTVFCSFCDLELCDIPSDNDVATFTNSLLEHLRGSLHMKNSMEIFSLSETVVSKVHFDQLLISNEIVKQNTSYIRSGEDGYHCKLCKLRIAGHSVSLLEESLTLHITGEHHQKNLRKLFYILYDKVKSSGCTEIQRFLLRKQERVCCFLCDCEICKVPLDNEDVDTLMHTVLHHFNGSRHIEMETAMDSSSSSTTVLKAL